MATPCPTHPTALATFTCARCGSFACEACRDPRSGTWCTACAARYATPSLPVGEVLGDSFGFLAQNPAPIAVFAGAHVLFGLTQLPYNIAMQESLKTGGNLFAFMSERWPSFLLILLGGSAFSSIAYALFLRFAGDLLEGPRRPPGELVRAALGRALPVFGTNLVLGLAMGVGFILCFAPGMFFAVALALALPATVLEPAGPLQAVSFSWTRTKGHRGNLLLLLLILGIVLVGVGMVGAVLNLVLTPLGIAGMAVGTAVSQGLTGVCVAVALTMLTVCYLRLTGRWLPSATSR